MALTITQTATQSYNFAASTTVTFSTPPTIGNAVIVSIIVKAAQVGATSVTDNQGNTYALAKRQGNASGNVGTDIWFCGAITATGTPFSVTATGTTTDRLSVAIEVSGGGGLAIDQSTGSAPLYTSGTTIGPLSALTGTDVILATAMSASVGSSAGNTITVAVPWIQNAEAKITFLTGEVDSYILTSAAGTTPSVSWTWDLGSIYTAIALVAFSSASASSTEQTSLSVSLG